MQLSFECPPELLDEVRAAYAVPERAYHNFTHVAEVLEHVAEVASGPGWRSRADIEFAVLLHDAVYQPGRRDNEARSADLAETLIARYSLGSSLSAARVRELIELTARHGRLGPQDVDAEAALFLDCDMAILGSPAQRFDRYDSAIANEYRGCMPVWMYRFQRRRFLKGLLARERIFLSDWFHARLDAAARANLTRALAGSRTALGAAAGR